MVKKNNDRKPFRFFWEEDINPSDEIERVQQRMNETMRKLWEGMRDVQIPEVNVAVGGAFPVDVVENDGEVVIKADLPGVEKKDVVVRATSTTLEIEAQQREERHFADENFFRQERRYGAFRRVITLPTRVDPDHTDASMENGVLEVRLPKIDAGKKRKEFKPK